MQVWMDGVMRNIDMAKVESLSNTLHYGVGVYEGERAYQTNLGPAIFRLKDHTKRLFAGAEILGINIPFTEEEIGRASLEVVRKNNLSLAYIRPLIYYGGEHLGFSAQGLTVHVLIAGFHWEPGFKSVTEQRGLRVQISSYRRVHAHPDLVRVKATGGYLSSVIAHRLAESEGFDEALLLDSQGYISEGPGENIFMVKNGVIYTPNLSSALAGITRDTVIQLAREAEIEILEKNITEADIKTADEVFFTGTAVEVVAISHIDSDIIGNGKMGPTTEKLIENYHKTVTGNNAIHSDWISHCVLK